MIHQTHLIGAERRDNDERIEVRNAFDGELVGSIAAGGPVDVSDAAAAAHAAVSLPWPAHRRATELLHAADLVDEHAAEIAELIAREGSKTIREARSEPPRAAEILRMSADAARTLTGETLNFDARPGSDNRRGYFVRKPIGVVGAILPFNDPVAVAAHKIGPALAGSNAVVVKPDPSSSLSVLRFCELLAEAGIPAGRVNVVTGGGEETGAPLVTDERVRCVSFTGGVSTGRRITESAGIKKLVLELGANSPVIVMPDARIDDAVNAITAGAFAQAGQNCLGVQRVFIHRTVYDDVAAKLAEAAAKLKAGHSMDESVDVCQMIRMSEAERVHAWIREAVDAGARVIAGGGRSGAVVEPTVLENVPDDARLACSEVYGPVVGLFRFDDLPEAVARANAVDTGLHGAVFTESLRSAMYVAEHLQVGGVIVNDSSDYRMDLMPFGGMKNSGIGREGIRFAAEEMTLTRVVCFNL